MGSQEAVEVLTTTGFEDVVLKMPEETEKLTKVIIFRYLLVLEPDFLLDDSRFSWGKRQVIKRETRNQVVALMRGEVPEKIFISGAGYRRVALYVEAPVMCLRCCKWGHMAWKCQEDPRCRYCARKHQSTVCADEIKSGTRVVPRCCNCGGEHNARYPVCPQKPFVERSVDQGTNEREISRDLRTHASTQPRRGGGRAATHGLMAGRLRQVFHHNENRRGEMSLGMESGRPYPWGEVVIMGGEEVMLW